MDIVDLTSCNICKETFDGNVSPRSLSCGHTFCTNCINNGIEGGLLSCAQCKKQHRASDGSDFPINYAFEALAKKFREDQLRAVPKREHMSDPQPSGSGGLSKKMKSMIHDQEDQLKSLLNASDEMKKDITEYKSYINKGRGKHTELCERSKVMLQQNEHIIAQLGKEDNKITDYLKEVEGYKKEANIYLKKGYTLTNATQISAARAEIEKVQNDLKAWNKKCKMQLPCTETIKESQKVMRKTTEALSLYEKDEDEPALEDDSLLSSGLSIMEKIKTIETKLRMYNEKRLNMHFVEKSCTHIIRHARH